MRAYTYTILTVVCLLAASGSSTAQQKQLYSKNLDAYVGTWEYRSGTEYFMVVLKRGRENTRLFVGECLVGGYLYQKNGQTIANYTANIPLEFNDDNDTSIKIQAMNAQSNPDHVLSNKLRLYFYDEKVGRRTMKGNIELLSSTKIRWILRDPRSEFFTSPAAERDQYTVPTDVVLTRVPEPEPEEPFTDKSGTGEQPSLPPGY